jgi:hypothetical protein
LRAAYITYIQFTDNGNASLSGIRVYRKNNHYPNTPGSNLTIPAWYAPHKYGTYYQYNSLNLPVYQYSPDGGGTRFVYDEVRRLVRSHNANQQKKRFSYTFYDYHNRVVEVGESAYTTDQDTLATSTTYAAFKALALGGTRSQITRTYYDVTFSSTANGYFGAVGQENLRGRVSTTMYLPDNTTTYEQATYYSYDIHGNVKILIHDNPTFGQKRLDYDYDLVSGVVKAVYYQKNRWDQFIHYYAYDRDNRLKWVQTNQFQSGITSMAGPRDQEAQYYYYKHGPLMRAELGSLRVQGLDYAYTIHGWLKGVNSGALKTPAADMGQDGLASLTNPNATVARDAFGFVLGYYSNGANKDYTPIGSATQAPQFDPTGYTVSNATPLYNGNIPQMITATREPNSTNFRAQRTAYQYDQLHRLKQQTNYEWCRNAFRSSGLLGNGSKTVLYTKK